MSALVRIEILISRVIVLDLLHTEIVHEFSRWLQITETVEVDDGIATLPIRHPVRSRTLLVVEIDDC